MSIKIVLPTNDGSSAVSGSGTKVYSKDGGEINGILSCDIRIRPSEAVTATMEVVVSEIENLEVHGGEFIIVDPYRDGEQ